MRILSLIAIILASNACASDSAAEDDSAKSQQSIYEIVRGVHRAQENTGFVFMVSHKGETVLTDFAGSAVLEHALPIKKESRFPVMSITKAFTGLALADAVADGLVELDRPVSKYLPDYTGEGAAQITLRQLATHMSGIAHTGHPDRRNLYVTHFDDANSSRSVYESKPLSFPPGTEYGYSSSGYNLIAAIIEAVSGENFKDYVQTRILDRFALRDTGFDDVLRPIDGRVRNYSFVDVWAQPWQMADELQQVPTWDFTYNLGGGNMYSTANDLLIVGNAFLNAEKLSRDVWETAMSRPNAIAAVSPWSLGWIHGEDDWGRKTIYITGATPGVQAALYIYPDDELVFVALANCWGKNSANADLVIGAPQRAVNAYLSKYLVD